MKILNKPIVNAFSQKLGVGGKFTLEQDENIFNMVIIYDESCSIIKYNLKGRIITSLGFETLLLHELIHLQQFMDGIKPVKCPAKQANLVSQIQSAILDFDVTKRMVQLGYKKYATRILEKRLEELWEKLDFSISFQYMLEYLLVAEEIERFFPKKKNSLDKIYESAIDKIRRGEERNTFLKLNRVYKECIKQISDPNCGFGVAIKQLLSTITSRMEYITINEQLNFLELIFLDEVLTVSEN